MFFKLLGGILIIVSSGLIGIAISNNYSNRLKEIRKFKASIQMLETEVIYGATPLPKAFLNISLKQDGMLKVFYHILSNNLRSNTFSYIEDAWNDACDRVLVSTTFKKQDIETIKAMGKVLGCSDIGDQEKHFKLFYSQISQNEQTADDERKKSERMYKSMGFLIGITICIILF